MKKSLTALALGVLMMAPPLLVPDAEASPSWRFGAGFWVHGALFTIGYAPSYGHRPDYFLRVKVPIRYRGYQCSDRCSRQGSYYYHHSSCPVVRHHLHRYGYEYGSVFARYAPDYGDRDGYRGDRGYYREGPAYGHRRPNRRPRYEGRYERRYERRSDRRHDWRHRGHGRSCPY